MNKCRYVTNKGEQCKRSCKGKFCWQHDTGRQIRYFLIFSAFIGLLVNSSKIYNYLHHKFWNAEVTMAGENLVCDRNTAISCNIGFDDSYINFDDHLFGGEFLKIKFKAGKSYSDLIIPMTDDINQNPDTGLFPSMHGNSKSVSSKAYMRTLSKNKRPYKLRYYNNRLFFDGKLYDPLTDELIGWLDGDEFGIIEKCSFSWNQDSLGLEIIDRYGNVAFSLDRKNIKSPGNSKEDTYIEFNGYFKKDSTFYIYTKDRNYTTKNSKLALHYIKSIDPLFDHFGKDSPGRRLKTE